jgi:penicillin amidase
MFPDGYPYPQALHWTWGDEMRGARVDELLRSARRFTLMDMMAFQHDELSVPARSLVPLLRDVAVGERVTKARDMLLDWDFVLYKDSIPAAIYVSWERRLRANVGELMIPDEHVRRLMGGINKKKMIDWLLAPDGRFGESPLAGRDALLVRSLTEAVDDLEKKLGQDMSGWKYGQEKFKHATIRHPLSAAVNAEMRAKLNVGPAPRGGYGSTLNNTTSGDNQTSGASFRIVADTENWDNSVGTSNPGQSGDPESPHYRDLFDLWAKGKYFPIFYSREKIESVTKKTLILEPGS